MSHDQTGKPGRHKFCNKIGKNLVAAGKRKRAGRGCIFGRVEWLVKSKKQNADKKKGLSHVAPPDRAK